MHVLLFIVWSPSPPPSALFPFLLLFNLFPFFFLLFIIFRVGPPGGSVVMCTHNNIYTITSPTMPTRTLVVRDPGLCHRGCECTTHMLLLLSLLLLFNIRVVFECRRVLSRGVSLLRSSFGFPSGQVRLAPKRKGETIAAPNKTRAMYVLLGY